MNIFRLSASALMLFLNLLLNACSSESPANQGGNNPSNPILPNISVSDTSVIEGDSGTSELVFRVSLSAISTNDVSVGYFTEDDIADSASDFSFTDEILLIKAGSLSNTARIQVQSDLQPEKNETMRLHLKNPSGASLGNSVATGTIIDDDVRVLNVIDTRMLEGDNGASEIIFKLTLDQPSNSEVSVQYSTKDDGATEQNADYVGTNGLLRIPANQLSATISITINGDTDIESDETFIVVFDNISSNAVLARESAVATIADDDRFLTEIDLAHSGQQHCFNSEGFIIACAATGQDGDVKPGKIWPDPRFSSNNDGTITDNLTLLIWPQDWNASGAHNISWQMALDHVQTLNANSHLGFNDWRLANRNELKSLLNLEMTENRQWLTEPLNGFQNINDLAYWSSTTYEHVLGFTDLAWVIVMNEDNNAIGTANKTESTNYGAIPVRGGSDYALAPVAKTGQVLCYDTSGLTIDCTVAGQGQDGELQLGYFWQTPRFTDNGNGTVTDNTTRLSWAATPIASNLSWQQAFNEIATLNSQAYLGFNDWRMPNILEIDSLINAGLATTTWLESFGFSGLQEINAWTSTTNRCVNPEFCRPTDARIFATSATPWRISDKTIANQFIFLWPVRGNNIVPKLPNIYVDNVSTVEGDSGNTDLTFTLRLSAKGTTDITVDYASSDNSAKANVDYLPTSGTLIMAAGTLSKTIILNIIGDTLIEPTEKVRLDLSNPSGAGIGNSTAFGMIIDNEQIPPVHLPQTGQKHCFDSFANVIPCAGTGQDGDGLYGVAWPNPRFVLQDNGTVNDKLTGLFWLADTNILQGRDPSFDSDDILNDGLVDWGTALNYVTKLNNDMYLGFNDWRLPNRNELNSLVNFSQADSALYLQKPENGFGAFHPNGYWTSTQEAFNTSFSWYIAFQTGFEGLGPFRAVLPVRSDQSNAPSALAKTGQTLCYSEEIEISCIGTGQDGELQVGIPWPEPRFTNNNDGTVQDNLTGLIWASDGNVMPTRDPGYDNDGIDDGAVTWQQALEYVAKLNAEAYLGYNDWRLPNIVEAQSRTLNQGLVGKWLSANGFSNFDLKYWTSSSHQDSTTRAWVFDKFERDKEFKTVSNHVWPIRAGQ